MKDKIIIISGVSGGIGRYLSTKFVNEGVKVFGSDCVVPARDLNLTQFNRVDITDYDQVEMWIRSIELKMKNINLINCAGISYNSFAHKSDVKKWEYTIKVNLVGTFNVIRSILPIMRNNDYGRIINLSSVVAQIGVVGTSAYAASKAGLWGMTKSIAKENGSKNITINNLNLGYFDIGIIKQVPIESQKSIKQMIPCGNFGDPINIYNSIKNLMNSEYINGISIDINGGLY